MSGPLLPPGSPIATVESRMPGAAQGFMAQATSVVLAMPIVVLVNDKTASGGEIIAAALRQGRHAIIMGRHTAGAGLVATGIPLGELGSMRFSTGRIILASGQPLGTGGLAPDVTLTEVEETYAPDDLSRDSAVRAALRTLQAPGG